MTRAQITKKRSLVTLAIGGAAAAAVAVAGCGGGSSGGTAATQAAPAAATNVTVTSHSGGGAGTYLTDASGRALYLFTADTSSMSMCNGACVTEWKPLVAAAPHAAGTVSPTMIAVSARSGGAQQVTYAGHPLYYFAGDSTAGQTNGQGLSAFGGKWWLVDTHGHAVKTSTSSSSGNMGGYGGY